MKITVCFDTDTIEKEHNYEIGAFEQYLEDENYAALNEMLDLRDAYLIEVEE